MKKETRNVLLIGGALAVAYLIKRNNSSDNTEESLGELGGQDEATTEDFGEFQPLPQISITNEIVEERFIIPREDQPDPQPIPFIVDDSLQSRNIPASFGTASVDTEEEVNNVADEVAGVALGLASFIPSSATKVGENIVSNIKGKPKNIFRNVATETLEETPLFGRTLTNSLKKVTPEAGEAVGNSLFKKFLKKIAGVGIKSVVGFGTISGIVYDTQFNNRGYTEATIANVGGDVVGGALGAVTAPVVLTGVGAAIPFAVSVGGQVATETVVYGVSDFFTGRKAEANSDRTTPLETEPLTEEQAELIRGGLATSLFSKGYTAPPITEEEAENANTRSTTVDEQLQRKIAENKEKETSSARNSRSNSSSNNSSGSVSSSRTSRSNSSSSNSSGSVSSSRTSRSKTNSAVTVTRQTGDFGVSKYTGNRITRRIIINKPKRRSRKSRRKPKEKKR